MASIPEAYRDLFTSDAFAHFATVMPDGIPHVMPVWVDYGGEHALVNTARGRQKERNVERNPKVGLGGHGPRRFVPIRPDTRGGDSCHRGRGRREH